MRVIGRLGQGNRPLIVAHRGSSGTAPENTLAAFRQALADGADMIELDVRLSKDGQLVVMHDRNVNRTTDGRGKVSELTLDQLKSLDAGHWFGRRFAGESVPTLDDVVDALPSDFPLNIEVKTDGQPKRTPSFEECLAHFIRRRNLAGRVIVSSFDHTFLHRLHRTDPGISFGVLYVPVRDFARTPSALARRVGASVFTCSIGQLRKRFAENAKAHGLVLGCYGVDTRRQMEKALAYGVDVIITNYPKQMRKFLP